MDRDQQDDLLNQLKVRIPTETPKVFVVDLPANLQLIRQAIKSYADNYPDITWINNQYSLMTPDEKLEVLRYTILTNNMSIYTDRPKQYFCKVVLNLTDKQARNIQRVYGIESPDEYFVVNNNIGSATDLTDFLFNRNSLAVMELRRNNRVGSVPGAKIPQAGLDLDALETHILDKNFIDYAINSSSILYKLNLRVPNNLDIFTRQGNRIVVAKDIVSSTRTHFVEQENNQQFKEALQQLYGILFEQVLYDPSCWFLSNTVKYFSLEYYLTLKIVQNSPKSIADLLLVNHYLNYGLDIPKLNDKVTYHSSLNETHTTTRDKFIQMIIKQAKSLIGREPSVDFIQTIESL